MRTLEKDLNKIAGPGTRLEHRLGLTPMTPAQFFYASSVLDTAAFLGLIGHRDETKKHPSKSTGASQSS